MKHISEVTDALLLDLARRIAFYRIRAAERSLTDAIETRGTAFARIGFLRAELENARRNRSALLSIPKVPPCG